jgi:phosphoglycolate phosphatase
MGLVMLDYDGVIVDSLAVFSQNFTAACRDHGFAHIQTVQDVIDLFEENVYLSMLKHGLNEATINEILDDYKVRQDPYLSGMPLFEGIPEVLERIAQKHLVFVITSNLSSATEAVLRQNGIQCIKEVIGAEQEKSKVRKIKRVCTLYPDLPAFYIGDTQGDMIEGREAGACPIAVTWGWHSEEQLLRGNPDYVARTPRELTDILCNHIT